MASNEQDLIWVYNPTLTPFTVKWGGYPYTLASGEKKVFPRFIAEHYAKHLADAILLHKEEVETVKRGKPVALLNNPVMRPKIVDMIILGVYSYFQDPEQSPADQIAQMVDHVNQGIDPGAAPSTPADKEFTEDYGLVPNKAIGTLKEPAAPPVGTMPAAVTPEAAVNDGALIDDIPTTEPVMPVEPVAGAKPKVRSLADLRAEADAMGVVYGDNETAEQIKTKLLAEAG